MNAQTPVEALEQAIAVIGSQSAFAAELSKHTKEPISQARVWNWVNRDGGAPGDFCPLIESLTGVRAESLRPSGNFHLLRVAKPTRRRPAALAAEKAA